MHVVKSANAKEKSIQLENTVAILSHVVPFIQGEAFTHTENNIQNNTTAN